MNATANIPASLPAPAEAPGAFTAVGAALVFEAEEDKRFLIGYDLVEEDGPRLLL